MVKHEKHQCWWNPDKRACASCEHQKHDFETVYNPDNGGNPGSTDYDVKTCWCEVYETDLYNPKNLKNNCQGYVFKTS